MLNVDATVMLYSDSELRRASAYHRGKHDDVVTLLAVAGIDDPAFGDMIIHAAVSIIDEREEQEQQPTEA